MSGFPTDWGAWRQRWQRWLNIHPELTPVAKAIPGKNMLADEILGTYHLPSGRTVELSEVTFPNLTERDEAGTLLRYEIRAVGMTWVDDRTGTVVHSFAELETELGLLDDDPDADDYLTEAKKETEL